MISIPVWPLLGPLALAPTPLVSASLSLHLLPLSCGRSSAPRSARGQAQLRPRSLGLGDMGQAGGPGLRPETLCVQPPTRGL